MVARWKWEFIRRNPDYRKDSEQLMTQMMEYEALRREKEESDDPDEQSAVEGMLTRTHSAALVFSEKWHVPVASVNSFYTPPFADDDHGWKRLLRSGNMAVSVVEESMFEAMFFDFDVKTEGLLEDAFPAADNLIERIKEFGVPSMEKHWEKHPRELDHDEDIFLHLENYVEEGGFEEYRKIMRTAIAQSTEHIHIRIPLDQNVGDIQRRIKLIIEEYKRMRKELGLEIVGRTRFDNYETYLKIYDMKIKGKKTWRQIAEATYASKTSDEDRKSIRNYGIKIRALVDKTRDNFKRAEEMVKGGWREIR